MRIGTGPGGEAGQGRRKWPRPRGFRPTVALALLAASFAQGLDLTPSGSIALDYRHFFATSARTPSTLGIDSVGLEAAQKVVVDVSPGASASVKVCAGCHGLEVDQAFAELQLLDWLGLRLGRMNVSFGEFNVRHDPANYTPPSKPLPYAMGDMLHYGPQAFNLAIVPAPYSDNGAELFGRAQLSDEAQLDFALYAVKGFGGTNDLDFVESRQFRDVNSAPALGGRLVATYGDFALGGSATAGTYDRASKLWYAMGGGELYGRMGAFVLRAEVLGRVTQIDPSVPGYPFEVLDPWVSKVGWYGQLDFEPLDWLTVLYRFDGLERLGVPLPGSELTEPRSGVLRHTAALLARFRGGLLGKLGYEAWSFYGAPYGPAHVVRAALVFGY